MPRPKRNPQPEKPSGKEAAYLLLPWTCKHYPNRSEIEAYIPGRDWETIGEVVANPGVDAEMIAEFINHTVNSYSEAEELIENMLYALELCLSCDRNLTMKAEREVQAILDRARKFKGS